MKFNKKRYLIIPIVLIAIGYLLYTMLYINIYGFTIRKSKIQDIIVYTSTDTYQINNKELLEKILDEMSKMKKSTNIENNFPPGELYSQMPKILLQEGINKETNSTYGGSLWNVGNQIWQDSNGYYWNVTSEVLDLINESIKDKETIKLH